MSFDVILNQYLYYSNQHQNQQNTIPSQSTLTFQFIH